MKDQFEQHLKTSLDSFEAKYDPAHWADMESRLNKTGAGKSFSGKTLGIAAGIIAVAGLVYYFSTTNSGNKQAENTITTAQNIVPNNHDTKVNSVQENLEKPATSNVISDNSKKEKVTAEKKNLEQKVISTEKSETSVVNNTREGKENNRAEVQQPPTPTSSSLNASFHSQHSVCLGTAAEFTVNNAKSSCTYRWDFGNGKTSGEQNPKHIYAKAGTYTVKLRLTSVKDKTFAEQKNTVVVNPVPNIDMNHSLSDENPSLVNFEAKDGSTLLTTGSKNWSWDFGDKQTSKEQNPSHSYIKKGSYDVVVTATNNYGCSSSARKLVTIENIFPLAPTGFSPNGDGINDLWMPASFLNGDYNFTLTIFDKSGKGIYTTADKNSPWNGANTKVGETFTWKAMVKDKNGKESSYSGVVIIAGE